jgi:hypothetical protein
VWVSVGHGTGRDGTIERGQAEDIPMHTASRERPVV